MFVINLGSSVGVDVASSGLPNVGDVITAWFLPMTFGVVSKTVIGFTAKETATTVDFSGVIQPMSSKKLMLLPEGQRAWKNYTVHADTSLVLDVDDIVIYQGFQYRVAGQTDYKEYGYVEYDLLQDYEGSGPGVTP